MKHFRRFSVLFVLISPELTSEAALTPWPFSFTATAEDLRLMSTNEEATPEGQCEKLTGPSGQ